MPIDAIAAAGARHCAGGGSWKLDKPAAIRRVPLSSRAPRPLLGLPLGLLLCLAAGCGRQEAVGAAHPGGPAESSPALTAAGGAVASAPAEPSPRDEPWLEKHGVRWYVDAPEAAFAAARASGKRVVVDLWAPWCHTCLSMQRFVLTGANLPGLTERFVWLSIDTERAQNAALLDRLPVAVWPTLYVIDPPEGSASGAIQIRGRWLGAASPAQLRRFLVESDPGVELAASEPWAKEVRLALAAGDQRAAEGRHAEAARAYAEALRQAPASWQRRPETWVALMTAHWKARDHTACLEAASSGLEQTGTAASAVDFSHYALACAEPLSSTSASVARLRARVAARLEPLCDRGSSELSPDDRADACSKLAAAHAALGQASEARRATLRRLAVLEQAAAGKPPEVAFAYDWARTDALLSLGRAEEALALATQRERELPGNYNPPHYRAKSLAALERWQEGLAALERAQLLAYGPRKIALLSLKADLLLGAGRRSDALQTLDEQLKGYRALPPGQRQPAAEARVEARLRQLEQTGNPTPAP